MSRIGKTIALLCAALLAALALPGCVTVHRQDTASAQKDYLAYSLGEYTVAHEKYIRSHSPVPAADHGYEWTARYTDAWVAGQTFAFNNVDSFGEQVYHSMRAQAEEQLETEFLAPHFGAQGSAETISINANVSVDFTDHDREAYLRSVADPRTGVRLRELTLKDLYENWLRST